MRIGYTVQDQQERTFVFGDQIGQIVFLILAARLHAGNDALVYRAFGFLVEPLAICHLHRDPLRFNSVDQRHQALVFATFQDKDFLKTLRSTFKQGLDGVNAVNNFTHRYHSLRTRVRPCWFVHGLDLAPHPGPLPKGGEGGKR
ncbi:Uncharacterised protein [Cedecea neteri]|uniref:Uncharacterized protein n=1 Tax=Cedecea neteri TaxID=158822 RepID=A0A2X2TB32_9ENTR|nr:Uncharacterised protein [Cedecea neteri]